VENSVKYAVSPGRRGAAISVRASSDDGRVRVNLEDNGPGFDPSRLPEGHGLALLRSRLQLIFGDRATMNIESQPGRTLITIDLPNDALRSP
jgi:LytS/YehU family sensor histidine kinase